MSSFTLDEIRAASEKKYGSVDIDLSDTERVVLVNPLRLSKENRAKLTGLQESMSAEGADQGELLEGAIRLVAQSQTQAEKLLTAIDGDLTILVEIFERYSGSVQAGEASASDD